MSESSFFFLVKEVTPDQISQSVKKLKQNAILFQATQTYLALLFEGDFDYYAGIHQKISKALKAEVLLYYYFEDFNWGYALMDKGVLVNQEHTEFEDVSEEELSYQIASAKSFLDTLGLTDFDMISYEYLVTTPSVEDCYSNLVSIEHSKVKRINRKKIFEELVTKPLRELGFEFSDKWKERANSDLFYDTSSPFRNSIMFIMDSVDGQRGCIRTLISTPHRLSSFNYFGDNIKGICSYKNEEEYRNSLKTIMNLFIEYGLPFMAEDHMEAIDLEEIIQNTIVPFVAKLGFTPVDYPRDRWFYTFDLHTYSNGEDIIIIGLNYEKAKFSIILDKQDPNIVLHECIPKMGGIIKGHYKTKDELMELVYEGLKRLDTRYGKGQQ